MHLARQHIQPDARPRDQVSIDPVLGRLQPGIGLAEPLGVPKVNPCLVLDLKVHVKVMKELAREVDDFVLSLPGHVFIEVKNVVILDAPGGGMAGLLIPHRLKQAAGGQHALVQAE
ncbi:hypothetical protein D3C84_1051450 [compost metagenome]